MKLAIVRLPTDVAATQRIAPGAAVELRFGDEVVVGAHGGAPTTLAGALRADRRELAADVAAGNLHLVVQIGDQFRRQWPDVPVLFDKGRYLLVDLPPARARAMRAHPSTCYRVRPAPASQTVFALRPAVARAASTPWIDALVNGFDRATIERDVRRLASFPTRHSTSAPFRDAAKWVTDELDRLGYVTSSQDVTVGTGAPVGART